MIMTNGKKASTFPASGAGKEGRKPGIFHSAGFTFSRELSYTGSGFFHKKRGHPGEGCPLFIRQTEKTRDAVSGSRSF